MNDLQDKVGTIFLDKDGRSQCVCIAYRNSHDCDIQFLDCGVIFEHMDYGNLKNGSFKSPCSKSIAGIGYIGVGINNIKNRPYEYKMWSNMINRCYKIRTDRRRDINYQNCYVSDEWHNFQNFVQWFDENIKHYKVDEPLCIDKDLLYKGNRIYSKYTCVLVPNRINLFLTLTKFSRGTLPIGVYFDRKQNKYKAQCCDPLNRYSRNLGRFNSIEEAFYKYKETKEKYAHDLAQEYSGKIDIKVLNALYNYKVDISD